MENPGLELMEVGNLEQGKTLEEVTQGHSLKDDLGHSSLWRRILQPFTKARSFYQRHAGLFKKILLGLLCLAYAAYLLAACILNFRRALALFVITCLVIFILACHFLKKFFAKKSIRCLKPLKNTRLRLWLKRVFMGAAVVALILWLALDTAQRPEQLISFAGICMFILILFACSKHHSAVSFGYLGWAQKHKQGLRRNYKVPMSGIHGKDRGKQHFLESSSDRFIPSQSLKAFRVLWPVYCYCGIYEI